MELLDIPRTYVTPAGFFVVRRWGGGFYRGRTGWNGLLPYQRHVGAGSGFALVTLTAIADPAERRRIADSLEEGGNEIFPLSAQQIAGFAGNLLHMEGARGPVVAMSETARRSLGPAIVARLERHGEIVAAPIETIERYGGGSVRCMLAEMFLPRTST